MKGIKVEILDKQGKTTGSIEVPSFLFGLEENHNLVHQVYTIKSSNRRKNYAHTKTRADVRGGGRKPWKQKGTGRARHGSSRSPIWVGGGVTFGPRKERNFSKKINVKMNRKAIATVLSSKQRNNDVKVIDSLSFKDPRTKEASEILKRVRQNNSSVLIFGSEKDNNFIKSFRNVERVTPRSINRISILDILNNKSCIFSKNALELLITRYADFNKYSTEGGKGTDERKTAQEG